MNERTKEMAKTRPEAAERLRALFARWAKEEAEGLCNDEPSWEEVAEALNEGRPSGAKPFSER
ncbi:MAG: hypothetical protein H0U91_07740 [Rubrobacter sp.]|jgi:hypothetical protein|nr:hypothetical protein [Rubrobacter sp.]MDQ3362154.1 hypothetical protein [Actinomycetota bacterium]MDQ3375403.1 hypothetical protein [Actinomycetota bacterium]